MDKGTKSIMKCNSKYAYCDRCIVDMTMQEIMGGAICCDTAEECDFDREVILLRCEHAEELIIGKEVQKQNESEKSNSRTDSCCFY